MAKFIYKNYEIVYKNSNAEDEDPYFWISKTFDYDAGKTYHTLKNFPEIKIPEGASEDDYPQFNCYKLDFGEDYDYKYMYPGDTITENYCVIELWHLSSTITISGKNPNDDPNLKPPIKVPGPSCICTF